MLAYDLYICDTGGAPPFYGECIYGTANELRGYTAGRYIDRHMITTQLEYRLALPKRFGVAAFAGIGEVFPGASQILRSNRRSVSDTQFSRTIRRSWAAGKPRLDPGNLVSHGVANHAPVEIGISLPLNPVPCLHMRAMA